MERNLHPYTGMRAKRNNKTGGENMADEITQVLKDIIAELHLDDYGYGDVLTVGNAIQEALRKHENRKKNK